MIYSSLLVHRLMLRDTARTHAFDKAIASTVRRDDVVLDVGAGSGILSLFAARAGARRVYAVEATRVARVARQLALANGVGNAVQVIEAPMEEARLPEPVDLIVSEWLGAIGVDENLLGMVLVARDRWLKPQGRLVPRRVTAWMAPVCLSLRPDTAFFRERPYGLDLAALAEASIDELPCARQKVTPGDLAARPVPLWTTDMATAAASQAVLPMRASVEFSVPRPATVNALAAWFSAELADGIELSNAPGAPDTHWGQLLLRLEREQRAVARDVVAVHFACIPLCPGQSALAWSVRVGRAPWEHHDTRTAPGLYTLDPRICGVRPYRDRAPAWVESAV